jgi:3-hydroxyacyl-[acyl-carrier-protein] dehydratase
MDGATKTDSGLQADFIFPPEFIGFQGHFPANKVLPGACQVQCVLSIIEKILGRQVVLKEIVLAKYIAPVFPGDNVTFVVNAVLGADNEYVYKARVTRGVEKVSELKLRVFSGDVL